MEPQQNKIESVIAPLKNVTPLSKYLAMTLFVILPFLGGWIGYSLAPVKTVEIRSVDSIRESKSITQKSTSTNTAQNTTEPAFIIFPVVSEECKSMTSEPDQNYAVYANDLTTGQTFKCDYERATGRTYELSSTTIRLVDWDMAQTHDFNLLERQEYKNVNLPKDLEIHSQLPYLIALSTTSDEIVLTSHCFRVTSCSFAGLYKFDVLTNTLSRMKTGSLFNIVSRASRVSPDRAKIISSDYDYDMKSPNSLYLVDLKTDTYKTLDTIDPSSGEGTFCTGGLGGCSDINVDWLPENKIEVQIFKKGGKSQSRIYSLE